MVFLHKPRQSSHEGEPFIVIVCHLSNIPCPALSQKCQVPSAEDIVPRLLAMRYAASLPAAAAEVVSQPQTAAQEEVTASQASAPEHDSEGGAQPSCRGTSASPAGSPSRPRWHASLSSGMDKLRALTGTTAQIRLASGPLDTQSQLSAAPAKHDEQRTNAQEESVLQQQSQHGIPARSYVPSWGPARYLPTFVPFGGQHHLHAPAVSPTAPLPSRALQSSESFEAEDAEALAVLRAQESTSVEAQAGDGDYHRADLYSSSKTTIETSQTQPSQPSSRPDQHRGSIEQAEAERVAMTRKYALPLTYHRMYTMRERAAAICSTAWPPDRGRSGPPVQLSQDLAPALLVTAANAQLPIWPPSPTKPSPPEAAYRR